MPHEEIRILRLVRRAASSFSPLAVGAFGPERPHEVEDHVLGVAADAGDRLARSIRCPGPGWPMATQSLPGRASRASVTGRQRLAARQAGNLEEGQVFLGTGPVDEGGNVLSDDLHEAVFELAHMDNSLLGTGGGLVDGRILDHARRFVTTQPSACTTKPVPWPAPGGRRPPLGPALDTASGQGRAAAPG